MAATNTKKNIAVAIFFLLALGLAVRSFMSKPPVAASAPTAAAPAPQARTAPASAKAPPAPSMDPTIRLDLLEQSEQVKYDGHGRNIFQSASAPPPVEDPKKVAAMRCKITPDAPGCPLDPCKLNPRRAGCPDAPPPITLKFFGFANKPGEPKKIFLSQGEDVFIAAEGEIVNRRYKVLHIGVNSVEIKDVLNDNAQVIPLSQS